VLEQVAASKDSAVVRGFFREIRDARDILARLNSLGDVGFAPEDEAALANLAIRAILGRHFWSIL
jgi:hypothetical protein